jgi:hypothetical protein
MKTFALRLLLFALLISASVTALAQDPARIQMDHLDRLFPRPLKRLT